MLTGCEPRAPKTTDALKEDKAPPGKNNFAEVLIVIECDAVRRWQLPGTS